MHMNQSPHVLSQVLDMCEYLRIGPNEDPYIRDVACMALSAPLPPGWEEMEDDMGNLLFKWVLCI